MLQNSNSNPFPASKNLLIMIEWIKIVLIKHTMISLEKNKVKLFILASHSPRVFFNSEMINEDLVYIIFY